MKAVYTREQWRRDRNFSAEIGQEVEEDIYYEMLDCLPPLSLPNTETTSGYSAGFRVGEPYIHAQSAKTGEFTAFYAAFGKKGNKYYFLGNMNRYGEIYIGKPVRRR